MNNAEAKEILDHNWTKLVNPDYSDEELGEAQNMATASLEAWEKIDKELEARINYPCINQNMMAQNIAYKEVKDIIKKHLREVEG